MAFNYGKNVKKIHGNQQIYSEIQKQQTACSCFKLYTSYRLHIVVYVYKSLDMIIILVTLKWLIISNYIMFLQKQNKKKKKIIMLF